MKPKVVGGIRVETYLVRSELVVRLICELETGKMAVYDLMPDEAEILVGNLQRNIALARGELLFPLGESTDD